jgi:integrase
VALNSPQVLGVGSVIPPREAVRRAEDHLQPVLHGSGEDTPQLGEFLRADLTVLEVARSISTRSIVIPRARRPSIRPPFAAHVDGYAAHLRNTENVSPKHLKETMRRLRFVLDGYRISKLSDVRADAVEPVLRGLAERGARGEMKGGASARTRNTYLASIRAFTQWCLASGRIEQDPLAPVPAGRGRRW